MGALDAQARREMALPMHIADAFVGIFLAEERPGDRAARIQVLAALADTAANSDKSAEDSIRRSAQADWRINPQSERCDALFIGRSNSQRYSPGKMEASTLLSETRLSWAGDWLAVASACHIKNT